MARPDFLLGGVWLALVAGCLPSGTPVETADGGTSPADVVPTDGGNATFDDAGAVDGGSGVPADGGAADGGGGSASDGGGEDGGGRNDGGGASQDGGASDAGVADSGNFPMDAGGETPTLWLRYNIQRPLSDDDYPFDTDDAPPVVPAGHEVFALLEGPLAEEPTTPLRIRFIGPGGEQTTWVRPTDTGTALQRFTRAPPVPGEHIIAVDVSEAGVWVETVAYTIIATVPDATVKLGAAHHFRGPPAWVGSLAVGDLDDDGDPDVLIGGSGGSGIWALINTLDDGSAVAELSTPRLLLDEVDDHYPLLAFDAVGSSALELVVGAHDGVRAFDLMHTADGGVTTSSASTRLFAGGGLPAYPGDLDGDGDVDLVISSNTFLRDGDLWVSGPTFHGTGWTVALGAADIDGDGRAEIGTPGLTNGLAALWRLGPAAGGPMDAGSGGDLLVHQLWEAPHAGAPVFGDFDGDGRKDVLIVDEEGMTFSLWVDPDAALGLPTASLALVGAVASPPTGAGVSCAADFDGDGREEVLSPWVDFSGSTGQFNFGQLAYQEAATGALVLSTLHTGAHVFRCATADFNGDGVDDVVYAGGHTDSGTFVAIRLGASQ